jgi:hypothetical protein
VNLRDHRSSLWNVWNASKAINLPGYYVLRFQTPLFMSRKRAHTVEIMTCAFLIRFHANACMGPWSAHPGKSVLTPDILLYTRDSNRLSGYHSFGSAGVIPFLALRSRSRIDHWALALPWDRTVRLRMNKPVGGSRTQLVGLHWMRTNTPLSISYLGLVTFSECGHLVNARWWTRGRNAIFVD